MATGIYRTVNGQKVELSAKQVKNFIMQVNKWTSEEYNKQRYITKNKLRTYEAFTGSDTQSPVKFLYFEAMAKKRYGVNYKPSMKREQIKKFASFGSQKVISKKLANEAYKNKLNKDYKKYVVSRFNNFIKKNEVAKRIKKEIKDPIKLEKALSDYANKIHLKIKENEEVESNQAIPFGETFGSTDAMEFDIDAYK